MTCKKLISLNNQLILIKQLIILRVGSGRFTGSLDPPGSKLSSCTVFSLTIENTKNINIQYGKFIGPSPKNFFKICH